MPQASTFRAYYWLTKPGIIYGNMLTASAGFFLASKGDIDLGLFVATIAGIAFVIASGCVFNNYIDHGIDKHMARTKKRATVTGKISGRQALVFATMLGVVGFVVLIGFVNLLTTAIGLGALFFYVVVYGFWKRRSTFGTVVGSIAGAAPPAAGYCAVTNSIDAGAIILFFILVCWQMPHFYSIAMYRLRDYAAASLPVLPVKKGMHTTKIYITLYIAAFVSVAQLLTVYGYTGYVYSVVLAILGLTWLWKSIRGFAAPDDTRWARTMFLFSLIVITIFSAVVAANAVLP